jgi:hypothetical protein
MCGIMIGVKLMRDCIGGKNEDAAPLAAVLREETDRRVGRGRTEVAIFEDDGGYDDDAQGCNEAGEAIP